jgi:ribosomal protein L11 methyltransferase
MIAKNNFILRIQLPKGSKSLDRDRISNMLAAIGPHFQCQGFLDWSVAIADSQKILAVESEFHDLSGARDESQAIEAWFTNKKHALEMRKFLVSRLPRLKISAPSVRKNQDWMKKWRAHYRPLKIGKNGEILWIVPAWQKIPAKARRDKIVWIYPGQAFGAGTHSSTQACLEAFLSETKLRNAKQLRVLDFGAGTGILGIAAIRVCSAAQARLTAVEIDPEARKILTKNLKKNRVAAKISATKIERKKYELIFANVLAPVLLANRDLLLSALSPQGKLILSGILKTDAKKFIAAFLKQKSQYRLERKIERGDWACFVVTQRAGSTVGAGSP